MFVGISGGRGDGTDWPPAGGVIELDDEEARHLVEARLGRYEPETETRPAPAPKRPAARPAAKPKAG